VVVVLDPLDGLAPRILVVERVAVVGDWVSLSRSLANAPGPSPRGRPSGFQISLSVAGSVSLEPRLPGTTTMGRYRAGACRRAFSFRAA